MQKNLLLQDLCARLPYRVMCRCDNIKAEGILKEIETNYNMCRLYDSSTDEFENCYIFDCKPYLFPISSMTKKQKKEYYSLADDVTIKPIPGRLGMKIHCIKLGISDNPHEEVWDYVDLDVIDWLNKNHFDYRGLIKKGLAIDATDKNIY